MKRKIMLVFFIIVAVVVCIVVFVLQKQKNAGASLDTNTNVEDSGLAQSDVASNDLVKAGNGAGVYYMDFNKTGVFYIENGLMKYCDYETAEAYVLCNQANCLHEDSDCSAYVGDSAVMAQWNGNIYAIIKNEEKNQYELTRMNLTGQDRTVITTLDIGEYETGSWMLNDLTCENVYFGYGKAYIETEYSYVNLDNDSDYLNSKSRQKLLLVDLEIGEISEIAESENYDMFHELAFKLINDEHIIYSLQETQDALVGEDLEEAIDNGEIEGLEELYESLDKQYREDTWGGDLYSFYLSYALYEMTGQTITTYSYDLNTGETSELYGENCSVIYDADGMPLYWHQTYDCLDWYGDTFVVLAEHEDAKTQETDIEFLKWNNETAQLESLFSVEHAAMPAVWFGDLGKYVRDSDKLIYMTYNDDGETAQVYAYSLSDGSSTALFEDDKNVTLRFLGETDDDFICERVVGDDQTVVKIDKTEYFAGNLDAVVKLMDAPE